jgi:hypothetical protein
MGRLQVPGQPGIYTLRRKQNKRINKNKTKE